MSQLLADDTPLTLREQQLLARLFRDPTQFPSTFRSWLPEFLGSSDMDLPMANVHGLLDQLHQLGVPVLTKMPPGTILLFQGDEAPEGSVFVDAPEVQAAAPPGLKFIRVT